MTRPDLKPDFNGWQASDPTPQEKSEGNEHAAPRNTRGHLDAIKSSQRFGFCTSLRCVLLRACPAKSHQGGRAPFQI